MQDETKPQKQPQSQGQSPAIPQKFPANPVSSYKMIEGDYKVIVRLLEANDLKPSVIKFTFLSSKNEACNSQVILECMGQKKKSKVVLNNLNPIFNEPITFFLKGMSHDQLNEASIRFTVSDNRLIKSAIIGVYEMDLTTIYFHQDHEYYQTWLTLTDPTDTREGVMGYLLVNINVLGPNDEMVVHTMNSQKKDTSAKEHALVPAKIQQSGHQIQVRLLRGENMPPLDTFSDKIDAYLQVKYSGVSVKSSVVSSRNPIWNELLNVACMLPNQSKLVHFEVYDRDLLEADDMVGTFTIPFKEIQDQVGQARWYNLYGAPICASNQYADLMTLYGQTEGSHYRGRILCQIQTSNVLIPVTYKKQVKFSFPNNPEPQVEQKSYLLRIDVYQLIEVPQRDQCYVIVGMGPYLLRSTEFPIINGRVQLNLQFEEKKVLFPKDISQVPDVIFYFADSLEDSRRHSFVRVPAASLLDKVFDNVLTLKEDKSLNLVKDDEFGGFLSVEATLFSESASTRHQMNDEIFPDVPYELRIFLYVARHLPPSDTSGSSDAYIKVRCAGKVVASQVVYKTLNPDWYETLKIGVLLQPFEKSRFSQGMMVMLYDHDEGEKDDLMGRCWITFQKHEVKLNGVTFYWHRPKWYNLIYDATGQMQGKVLLSYALIPQAQASKIPITSIVPTRDYVKFSLYTLGMRGLKDIVEARLLQKCYLEFSVQGQPVIATDKIKVANNGLSVNQMITFNVAVPRNEALCPMLEIRLIECSGVFSEMLLGIGLINFMRIIKRKLKGKPHIKLDDSYQKLEEIDLGVPWERSAEPSQLKPALMSQLKDEIRSEIITPKVDYKAYDLSEIDMADELNEKSPLIQQTIPKFHDRTSVHQMSSHLGTPFKQAASRKLTELKQVHQNNLSANNPPPGQIVQVFQQGSFAPRESTVLSISSGKQDAIKKSDVAKYQFVSSSNLTSLDFPTKVFVHEEFKEYAGHDQLNQISEISIKMAPPKTPEEYNFEGFGIRTFQYLSQASELQDTALRYDSMMSDNAVKAEPPKPAPEKQTKKDKLQRLKSSAMNYFSQEEEIVYLDFDTDPNEDLDTTPAYLKGRDTLSDNMEDLVKMDSRMRKVKVKRGQTRGHEKVFLMEREEQVSKVGLLRCIFVESTQSIEKRKAQYTAMMRQTDYLIRVYVLEGMQIVQADAGIMGAFEDTQNPDLYLKLHHSGRTYDLKQQSLRKDTLNPQFYISYELIAELPGPGAFFSVEVWQDDRFQDNLVGRTEIDLEERYFSKAWRAQTLKNIESRNLLDENNASVGRLQLWIDLVERSQVKANPLIRIGPPPRVEFELRVIIWSTKAYTYKDEAEKCNDVYVRAGPGNQEMQETDVHWRCRGTGSFNWRMKWNVKYPMLAAEFGNDILQIQMWDKDLLDSNDLIGEAQISLNIHKLIDKACKRRKAVQVKMEIKQHKSFLSKKQKKGKLTDSIWFDVFHPEYVDASGNKLIQGKVLISIELVPTEEASKKENGLGRNQPNNYPNLPEPVGRLNFDISHPLDFLKEILGPDLYHKICWMLFCSCLTIFMLSYGWQFIVQVILMEIK